MPRLRQVKVNTVPEVPAVIDEPDKPVTIDVSDAPLKKDAKEELEDGKGQDQKEIEVVTPEEPEGDDEKVALLKRLDDLTKAEETRAKADKDRITSLEAERAEFARQAQQHQADSTRFQAHAERAQLDAVLNAIDANKTEADKAQGDYETALSNSDYKGAAEAQRRGQRAEAQLVQLEQGKDILESQLKAAERAPRREAPVDSVEASIANLPDPAKNWLRTHRDYMTDQRKNAKIQSLHWEVIDEGHQPFSTGYFESLETHLGMRQPKEPEKKVVEEPETRRNPPVSAPVTRDVPSASTGRAASTTRVTLRPDQREAARFSMPDLPPAEAEKIYAQNLLKLQDAKKDGHYSESR